ncbi:carbohydrate kinase family protein [Brevibacillus dissolubilis]|uniref:carbohydrate kinase family protein n=1 Tax=Brevibacillus dissolubilis TaxID=1844116 RepID=UPI00159B89EC|nr:carbohydrate kinase family protein [Brevibacillus dissolubilis]
MTNTKQGNWLVIGGANVDIKAEPSSPLVYHTSNPGVVRLTAGGVGRNVAENLARLGEEVTLCALVGEDTDGEWLRQMTGQSGVSTVGMLRVPGQRTGRYIATHDEAGEMVVAVADMAINLTWTDEQLAFVTSLIKPGTDGLFIDTNLPRHAVETIIRTAVEKGCPVIVDPVSVKKAEVVQGLLDGITLIAPGREEAAGLTGLTVQEPAEVERAAHALREQGVACVMITCGSQGVYVENHAQRCWLPAPSTTIRDVTGAGDAFTAGVMYGMIHFESLIEQTACGLSMAGLALSSEHSTAATVDRAQLHTAKEAYLREHSD